MPRCHEPKSEGLYHSLPLYNPTFALFRVAHLLHPKEAVKHLSSEASQEEMLVHYWNEVEKKASKNIVCAIVTLWIAVRTHAWKAETIKVIVDRKIPAFVDKWISCGLEQMVHVATKDYNLAEKVPWTAWRISIGKPSSPYCFFPFPRRFPVPFVIV